MRLRDWRPNGEVIAPLAYREQMAREAQAELQLYVSSVSV
jgi:CRISPR-associated protein (TIGR03985 family)